MNNTYLNISKQEIIEDYKLAFLSRQVSLTGRKEVFMGKAKFGIFGDGKEVAQVAMARAFKKGDWRSGYYRDQTFIFATGELSIQEFFAQIYAHTDVEQEPSSGGRMMNAHFGSRFLDEKGNWKNQLNTKNTTSDVSSTGGQIARTIGLGYASKMYRENPELKNNEKFSNKGNEIVFSTIGNASTSEGVFLEAMNAIGVMQIPVITSVWDDDYGISVPNSYHTVKESISDALVGLKKTKEQDGLEIHKIKGWDYLELRKGYENASQVARKSHQPTLIHVTELTQPQGHSTSGSHERYKSKERLDWEKEYDCIYQMKKWILEENILSEIEIQKIENECVKEVKEQKNKAWKSFVHSFDKDKKEISKLLNSLSRNEEAKKLADAFNKIELPSKLDFIKYIKKALRLNLDQASRNLLAESLNKLSKKYKAQYSSHLYSQKETENITEIKAIYKKDSKLVDGREVINKYFDSLFERDNRVFAFGEDVGKIGDVNQGMAGLQDKYGELRIHDTSIREMTIIGEGIGTAIRGLRPIAEIQYLDYIYYALNVLTDDLACMHYRTAGGQIAPVIVRTRGHRLEGVWHSGSPMSTLLGSIRGMFLLVPRNLTQAAGMYNTLLKSDNPAMIIECLNAYRQKERLPENLDTFTVPLGKAEILKEGKDVTIVTYGAMCKICEAAVSELEEIGISCELIDVQTLIPFDIHGIISNSIKKTNRVLFADEDVSGGATGYMMQQVLEKQGAYNHLDSAPATISAKDHRPAYGSDGDYFSKPNIESVFDKVYEIMSETNPMKFKNLYK